MESSRVKAGSASYLLRVKSKLGSGQGKILNSIDFRIKSGSYSPFLFSLILDDNQAWNLFLFYKEHQFNFKYLSYASSPV